MPSSVRSRVSFVLLVLLTGSLLAATGYFLRQRLALRPAAPAKRTAVATASQPAKPQPAREKAVPQPAAKKPKSERLSGPLTTEPKSSAFLRSAQQEKEPKRYDQPDEAAQFYLRKRAPLGTNQLPMERYLTAQQAMEKMPQYAVTQGRLLPSRAQLRATYQSEAARQLEALGTWTALGPGNVGGRTRALLLHPTNPSVMYAAGVAGGVWKTTNGGAAWTPIGDLLPNLAVCVLTMDPKNPEIIYAGTGEGFFNTDGVSGLGIFKTTDGGTTWARLPGTEHTDFRYINDLVISPTNSQRLYAATGTGVYRSLNGGASWARTLHPISSIAPPALVNGGCLDLVIRTDKTTDYLFASCGTGETATVYRNTDAAGAGTWTPVLSETAMGRTSLALAPSDQSIVYAAAAGLGAGEYQHALYAVFRSANNGAAGTWTAQVRQGDANKLNNSLFSNPRGVFRTECLGQSPNYFSNQGWYDNVIAVDPADSNRVWVGGIDWFRSDDGGKNWGVASYWWANGNITPLASQYAHADQHVLAFHPGYNGTTNQTLFIGGDGGIFRSDNARASVATGAAGPCNPAHSNVTWTSLNNGYSVTQFYHGLPYPDGETFFGGTQDNGTLRGSVAGGTNNWKEILGGDGGPVAIDATNPNVLYASNPFAYIQKSLDGGATFTAAITGLSDSYGLFINPFVMDPSDPQRLWTGGAYLWLSTNGATSWRSVGSITPGRGVVSALAVAATNANKLLVGMTAGELLRTDNALTFSGSWPTSYLSGWVSSVAFDPTDAQIAYATVSTLDVSSRVYRSTDGGATWTSIDGTGPSRIPNVPANSIVVDPTNTARLFVATDLGVFVSTDRGASWAIENTGFANVPTESLALRTVNGVTSLYAFTHGRGVWRVTLGTSTCDNTIASASQTLTATGGAINVSVTASSGSCDWTALSNVHWITVNSGASGTGNGTVNLSVAPNNTNSLRVGTVTIAGKSFTVTQEKCNCAISPGSQFFAPSGGTGSITVTANSGIGWQAVSHANWVTINSGASGTGNGTVTFTVAAHTSTLPRTGTITVAGLTFTATQLGVGTACTATAITPGTTTNGSLATSDCRSPIKGNSYYADRYSFSGTTGQAVSIAVNTNSSFLGGLYLIGSDGAVLASNDACCTTTPRLPATTGALALPTTGTYLIEVTTYNTNSTGDYSVTLTTTPSCTYAISPSNQSFPASESTGNVNVTTGSTCAWQASSNVTWLTINSGSSSGTGNGTVAFTVAANKNLSPRTGTLNVAGQVFTVTQAAQSCSVTPITLGQSIAGSLSSSDCHSPLRGGSNYYADRYSFTGTAGQQVIVDQLIGNFDSYLYLLHPDGSILAGADYPLIRQVLPTSGTYTIEVTSWPSFTTGSYTLTLSATTAGCTYEVTPGNVSVAASGGAKSVEIKASGGCQWQASSSVSWLTFAASSGSGSAKINFTVEPTPNSSTRSGTIQIAGQTINVTQLATVGNCTATPITLEQPVNGSLSSSDCRSVNGSSYYADRYSFTGAAGQTIAVSANSTAFSPRLALLAPDGAALAQGSRLPDGNDFIGLPANGTYIIEVSSYSSFVSGNYTVRLSTCTFALSSPQQLVTASGGAGTLNVTTTGNCAWQATTTESWITLNSGMSGAGNGTINFTVAANTSAERRFGRISVAGQTFYLTQTGQNCPATPIAFGESVSGSLTTTDCRSYSRGSSYYADRYVFYGQAGQLILIDQPTGDFDSYLYLHGPDGGFLDGQDYPRIPSRGYLTLRASGPYLIEVTSYSSNVTGSYTLRLSGSNNCGYALSAASQSVAFGGGTGTVNVMTSSNCAWQATSDASWVTITAGAQGSGSGAVSFTVAANTGSARSATLSIAGQRFVISQLGDSSSCTTASISQGQTLSGSLSTSDCRSPARGSSYYADRYAFTASAGQAISVLANTSFTGSLYLIGPNGAVLGESICCSQMRLPNESGGFLPLPVSGTYIIEVASYYTDGTGNYDVTLTSTAECSLALGPQTQAFNASSATGYVQVTTPGNCHWAMTTDAPWLAFTSSNAGRGNGRVNFSLQPNFGAAARTATLSVAGQSVTVTQAGRPCTATAINSGQVVNSTLGAGDCQAVTWESPSHYADRYSFNANAGQVMTVTLNSAQFDGYLTLIGPNGMKLLEDDDGGDGLNARLPAGQGLFTLPTTGPYTIEVTSFAAGATGNYELRLTLANAFTSVSGASYLPQRVLASEAIASGFGVGLAAEVRSAAAVPLPTELDGTTVKVRDSLGVERLAPLFFVSPTQINYLVPTGTALGLATVISTNKKGEIAMGTIQIQPVAPGLFAANADGRGAAAAQAQRIKGQTRTYESVVEHDATANRFICKPIDLGTESEQVYLELYGTGLRAHSALANVRVLIGGKEFPALYAGVTSYVGLDQVNVLLARDLIGSNEVEIVLIVDGQAANPVKIRIK